MGKKYHYTGGGANRSVAEVERLKTQYDEFNKDYLHQIFKDVLGLEVSSVKIPQNTGLPHIAFVVQFKNHPDLFYRGNLGWDQPETQLVKEKLIADLALKHDVPANKILHVDISRNKYPFDFQIQEVLGGLDAEVEFNGTNEDYNKYSFSLGQNIAKMSQINLSGFGHFADERFGNNELQGEEASFYNYINLQLAEQLQIIEREGFISAQTSASILKLFSDARGIINETSSSLVHYDLADHNLRYSPKTFETVAIYDWEASVAGDSLLDLASCPSWKTLFPRKEKLRAGFLSLVDRPDNLDEKIDLYFLRTIIWKVDHNIKFGIATPVRLKRLDIALEPFGLKTTLE